MPKLICVFGATGLQGGSVVRSLVQDQASYAVRAVTRNPDSEAAKALAALGVEVVKGDLNDRASLGPVLDGVYGCFLVTELGFSPDREEREITQGKNVADVAAEKKIQHIVFSSLLSVRLATGKPAANCDAKAAIDDYMRENDLPVTSVIFPFYFQNIGRRFKPKKLQANTYGIGIPMGDVPFDVFDIDQAGSVVRYVFDNPETTMKKIYKITSGRITVSEITEKMTKVLTPYVFTDLKVTTLDFRQRPFAGATDLANMFDRKQQKPSYYNYEETKQILPDVRSFEQYLIQNKDYYYSLLE